MSGFKDDAAATDHVETGLHTEVSTIEHPCPICGKAMKDANTREDTEAGRDMRICSNRSCRAKAEWSSGVPVLLTSSNRTYAGWN